MGRETAAGTRRGREIQQQVVRERRSSSGGMEKREAAGGFRESFSRGEACSLEMEKEFGFRGATTEVRKKRVAVGGVEDGVVALDMVMDGVRRRCWRW